MKIAVDIDDVLADFNSAFIRYVNRDYGYHIQRSDLTSFDYHTVLKCSPDEAWQILEKFYYQSPDFAKVKPVVGAVEAIEHLQHEHDLIVVTSRPEESAETTIAFLEAHFGKFYTDLIFTNQAHPGRATTTKVEVCLTKKVAYLIEDNLAWALECAKSGIPVLLYDVPWNQTENLPANVQRVHTWQEILKKLTQETRR